uniref:Uncharacterized protein n=1 Tax=Sphaerodactylus townsendi TaxID=933632 RepID=A0ACB8FIB0_9SAUR
MRSFFWIKAIVFEGFQHLEAREQQLYGTSPVDVEINLESYQTALEGVLSWLLTAEESLQAQGDISTDVEEVKEQFHTHEGFMMELTAHQGRVGHVLQVGSQLLSFGKLSEEEENEIQEQINLLNSRWENLRVTSMEKQSKPSTLAFSGDAMYYHILTLRDELWQPVE